MSSDKRRQARVQGAGWSASTNRGRAPMMTNTTANVTGRTCQPANTGAPSWLGKTVDQPKDNSKQFVYEEPEEEIKAKPKEVLITKMGVYDISTEPSGVSRLRFFPNFIETPEADEMYGILFHELPWKQKNDIKNGVEYPQPRLTAWCGDVPYSYSGVTHQPDTKWHPILIKIRELLEDNLGLRFNSVLANLYRDNRDHVSWHADDEKALRENPTIASISLGDVRNFELRKNPSPESAGDYTYSETVRVPLPRGSLLIMEGATQQDWQHRLTREYHERFPRINLTFRVTYPE